jgi:Tol biopolymer transport system component/PKD repeat protein
VAIVAGCKGPPLAVFTADIISGPAPLSVTFYNTSTNAAEFQWDFGDGRSTKTIAVKEPATKEPITHEYTKAGSYTVTMTAIQKGNSPKTNFMTQTITVNHGPPAKVVLDPVTVELNIGQSQEFSAEVFDAYNNPIPEAQLTWEIAEGAGTIDGNRIFTTGTQATTFEGGVTVTAKLDTYSIQANASVMVKNDPLEAVTLSPISIAAGETQQLEVVTTDQYGNPVGEVDMAWSVIDENAGSITEAGLFTAGKVAMSFDDVVEVQATQGELVRTAMASVTIEPEALEQVIVTPNPMEIGMGMIQQFVAVGADQYGNRISGLTFTWSVENGGGTIDTKGLFTSGETSGIYDETVKAEATQGGITQSSTASVTVEPDRIVFVSDRNNDQFDIYIMDMDGGNQDRLTSSGIGVGYISCSPDGRRIAYWIEGDILTINKDGTWNNALLFGSEAYEPAWSPDGKKIAFQSWKHDPFRIEGNSEIYTMDVDGGNLVRLTDNSAYDDYPAWSPDGTMLAFISDRDGNEEIYVMNADGSKQRRLTNHNSSDVFPVWSPDGTEIAFQSGRVGGESWGIYIMDVDGTNVRPLQASTSYISNAPSWSPDGETILFSSTRDADQAEIYIMDQDGSDVIRLTTNLVNDVFPRWVPRKKGMDVTEDSLIIPETSTLKAMTTRTVTDQARSAVVRIETDLGLGSGFIIDSDGLIMTNNHVISDAKEITVYLEDGTSYTGTIGARDLVHDLAIVKIKATELPYLEIGDLSEVGLGQQVLVLGYPLGVENIIVTSGLVSTIDFDIGRNIVWVQTDSAINPGNSGGPMLDLRGKVIGIVSAKLVGTAVEGIGFGISANTVKLYLPMLKSGETIIAFS